MIDSLLSEILGGLFGPALAQWLSRFRYWAVFFVAMFLTQALGVAIMLRHLGLEKTIKAFSDGINPIFFLVPAGIGAVAVIVALIGALNAPKQNDGDGIRDRKP